MKRRTEIEPQLTARSAGLQRIWAVEPLEQRLLLSGVSDGFGVRKAKFVEADGDKIQIKLSAKGDTFDIAYDRDGTGGITGVDAITLHGTNPSGNLAFKVKPAKGGASDGIVTVDSILSGNAGMSLTGINATNAQIGGINLTGSLGSQQSNGSFTGSIVTNRDLGSVAVGNLLANITIQDGHDLTGTVSAAQIGRITLEGGDVSGNITTTSGIGVLSSIQAQDLTGTVTAAGGFSSLTLKGDLSGDVAFGKGTLVVLIGHDLTSTGSIVGNDPGASVANIDAGGLTRTGVTGNVSGLLSAEGTLGLGVGGSVQDSASISAGGDLTVKAGSMSSNLVTLTSTGGDVYFAMNTGGFAGTINSADDVFGNGANQSIVIRGGNFTGTINAGGDVAAMTFQPTSGGFNGTISAVGIVNDLTASFFGSSTSVTGASLGNITAIRGTSGDAIAAGATFHATGLVDGNIGNVTASAVGSIAIGGSFVSDHGNIGNVVATSTGNATTDHAISGAVFTAAEGSIGTVTATAKAGHGISNSNFTAATALGNLTATSLTGNGFNASTNGQNLFTVTNGSLSQVTGSSTSGDGIHGGTFSASNNVGDVKGSSVNGSGIGDETGAVTTTITATTGSIQSVVGSATGGAAGSAGDGIANVVVTANKDDLGSSIGAFSGSSRFGNGISNARVSAEGDILVISGTTSNSDPSLNVDGISGSVFRTAGNMGAVTATTGVSGGAGLGAAIDASLFSAAGSIAPSAAHFSGGTSPGPLTITSSTDGNALVNALFGGAIPSGITINDIDVVAPVDPNDNTQSAVGLFQGFPSLPVGSAALLPDGLVLTTGLAKDALGPNTSGNEGTINGGGKDSDLDSLNPGAATHDAASLTITFTSDASVQSLSALFVFGSEEYSEFVHSPFNDIFGVFLDGETISNDPNGHIINVNNNYFLLNNTSVNPPDDYAGQPLTGSTQVNLPDLQYDGLTPILQVSTPGILAPGTHTLKLAIADVSDSILDSGVFVGGLTTSSHPGLGNTVLPGTAITATGDIVNSKFLAGYDIGGNLQLNGTNGDAAEHGATEAVSIQGIKLTGDWINSFAASGIATSDATLGNGDDTLSAPGSSIGNIEISSNIAGITGGVATNNFQSDALGNITADAIGIDPNSGSDAAAVGFNTQFTNGNLGGIGDITASTSTQRQAIADGTVFHAGGSIASITAINENTSFANLDAMGTVTFEAGGSIGDIHVGTPHVPFGIPINGATFTAHANDVQTGLAVGNVKVETGDLASDPTGILNSLFDASHPTVAGTTLNIGTIESVGDINATTFVATGDIARGVAGDEPLGIQVTGNIFDSVFNADSDVNNSGSLAAVGGIHVLSGFSTAENSAQGHIAHNLFTDVSPMFHAGSNDATSGLAIGDITVDGGDLKVDDFVILYAVDGVTFDTGPASGLNIGKLTVAGSVGTTISTISTFSATGNISDMDVGGVAAGSVFLADSDGDHQGDIGAIKAGGISDATFTANNVALGGITVAAQASQMTVTATTGSIGNLLVSQDAGNSTGVGASDVTFTAAKDIGNIAIRYTKAADDTGSSGGAPAGEVLIHGNFLAGQVDATGKIGDITLENMVAINTSDVLSDSHFTSGSGGIGNIVVTSLGTGHGIVDSSFRTVGEPSLNHGSDIGNITVVTVPLADTPNDGIVNSVFSARGDIGTGLGNASGHNIDVTGHVRDSRFLAGFDIGADLALGTGDDVFSSAISHINNVSVTGQFIGSDLVAGVDAGNGQFGDFDDTTHVIGSSLGTIALGGSDTAGQGGFVFESPMTDRVHAIEADLIGQITIGGSVLASAPSGYLDNGGGAADVNIRVL